MKWIYLSLVPTKEKGVGKKIDYQILALRRHQKNVIAAKIKEENNRDYFYYGEKKIMRYIYKNNIFGKIINKICLLRLFLKLRDRRYYKGIEVVYVRFFYTYSFVLSYYKFLKKLGIKIILEIPTYPYDGEIKKENIFTKMDKKYRKYLYKYIDKIVTYSNDEKIWGIPCINISNGIDLESVKMVEKKEIKKEQIVFTIVSNCSFWHGIDRFLNSLIEYKKNNGKKQIIFNIVGKGPESLKLEKIVDENPILKNIVIFHGFRMGNDLDNIYNMTDIAVGCLGNFRKNIQKVQALKNLEYCAKGIPMIYSEEDKRFENEKFVYKVSHDEKLFDLEKIIEWYLNLKTNEKEIREHAKSYTWDIQMQTIINKLNLDCKEGR